MVSRGEKTQASTEIMSRLVAAAQESERGQRTLETLRRLKIACDDIASGAAATFARKAGDDGTQFELRPPRINSRTVGEYVKLRRRVEGEKLWPGPHETTLRADPNLKLYLDARQTEASGSLHGRKPKSTRAQSINIIVSRIPEASDRFLMMQTVEEGLDALRQLQIVKAAAPRLWGVEIDAIIAGDVWQGSRDNDSKLSNQDRLAVRQIVSRISNNRELREFGLIYENDRVKAMTGTGAHLISKTEMALLRKLAKINV